MMAMMVALILLADGDYRDDDDIDAVDGHDADEFEV